MEQDDNCILINTMGSSDDMSVRDKGCSTKRFSAGPEHLRKETVDFLLWNLQLQPTRATRLDQHLARQQCE